MEIDEQKINQIAEQIILNNGIKIHPDFARKDLTASHLNTLPVYSAGKHVGYVAGYALGDDGAFQYDSAMASAHYIHGLSSYEHFQENIVRIGLHESDDGGVGFAMCCNLNSQDSTERAQYTIDVESYIDVFVSIDSDPFSVASIYALGLKAYFNETSPSNMPETLKIFERHYPDHIHLLTDSAPDFMTAKLSSDRFKTARQFTEQFGHFNIIESGFAATLISADTKTQPLAENEFSILSYQGRVKHYFDIRSLGYKHYLNAMVKRYVADNGCSLPAIIHTRDLVKHFAPQNNVINIPAVGSLQP